MNASLASLLSALQKEQPSCQNVWKWFLRLSQVPRPSHQLEQVHAFMRQAATEVGADFATDDIGNIRLRKTFGGNSHSHNQKPVSIAFQAHMDMVCTKTADSKHEFTTDPISLVRDGDWLHADGTTLGADNGLGLCALLALLEDFSTVESARPVQFEVLATVNEETDMSGAEQLAAAPFLESKYMINVDSEEEGCVCIGCAGGFETIMTLQLAVQPSSGKVYHMALSGLRGGHTGIDIHEGRANALHVMHRLLHYAVDQGLVSGIVEWQAGNAVNAIPSTSEVTVMVTDCASASQNWMDTLQKHLEEIMETYGPIENNPLRRLQITAADAAHDNVPVVQGQELKRLFAAISVVPHGVVRMSPDVDGLVETSTSFSLFSVQPSGETTIHLFTRGSRNSYLDWMKVQLDGLALTLGCKDVRQGVNSFPGWLPQPECMLTQVANDTGTELFGKSPRVYAVHAGLECGFIQGKYPSMQCVSIGPQIEHAHSPEERARIGSVPVFYQWLTAMVQETASKAEP